MSDSVPCRLLVAGSGGRPSKISWRQVLAWALAAFFVAGSLSNIFAPRSIIEVTGSLELTTTVLLARAATRLWGAALGCTLMCAALGTVIIHSEYAHAAPPLVVAGLAIVVGLITWRNQLSGSA
jgi:hypothetical protein